MKKTGFACLLLMFMVMPLLCACGGRAVLTEQSSIQAPATKKLKIWFVKVNNEGSELVGVERPASGSDQLESAVKELLNGPSPAEAQSGLGSEIPLGTILLGVKNDSDRIEVDLSRRFASGGATSFQVRLEQLGKTVGDAAQGKDVYLNVEGQRLTMTQGEGLEVKQPINK